MAEINLAPGTEYAGLLRKRRRRVLWLTVAIAAAVLAAWGGLFIYEQQLIRRQQEVNQRLASVAAEITRLGEAAQRVTLFEGRTHALESLLVSHISWDPLLRDLERLLPAPVIVNRLKVNVEEGTVELAGETPDLDVVAQTLASLIATPARASLFTSGSLENSNRVPQENVPGDVAVRYEFGSTLTFDREKLHYAQP